MSVHPEAPSSGRLTQGLRAGKKIGSEGVEKIKQLGGQGIKKGAIVAAKGADVGGAMYSKALIALEETYEAVLTAEQKQAVQKKKQAMQQKLDDGKARLVEMSDVVVDKVLAVAREALIETATDDADMPKKIQSGIASAIKSVWPDVAEEVKYGLHCAVRPQNAQQDGPRPHCLLWPRAFIMYHYMPYNRSIWRSLRDPW
mmetsp:Transcript_11203/g.21309  ORF Transcript_11203/g.21309 Transcript_11203/m.21309 type:complete len:200 (+) Transcript_11203:41-640(+)